MSKRYVAIDMRDSTVIKKYNRDEFSSYMSQVLHDFAVKNGLNFFYYSNEYKAKYADKFIEYWNNNFYSFGKQTRLNVYRDSDDGYIKHIDGLLNKLDLYYIAFGKITKADKDYYQVSFVNPQWVLFNFNDVNFLHSSITGYHYQKRNFFTKRRRYAGVRNKHHFERYYAELADDRYWKSIGAPLPRRMNGTLKTRNCWEDWEDEVVSTKGNWKHSTKCKHQWDPKQKRLAKRNNITDVSFLRTPEQYIDGYAFLQVQVVWEDTSHCKPKEHK